MGPPCQCREERDTVLQIALRRGVSAGWGVTGDRRESYAVANVCSRPMTAQVPLPAVGSQQRAP